MKVPVLELNKVNGNNRLYSSQAVAKALSKGTEFMIFRNPPTDSEALPMDQIIGRGKAAIESDFLVADCTFTDDMFEKAIQAGELHVRPSGMGSLINNEVMDDYRINCLFLTDKPA